LRPWPGEGWRHFAACTLDTWWYDYAISGFAGITGSARCCNAGKSRTLEDIPRHLNWHRSSAGLQRDIFHPSAADILAAARNGSLTIQPERARKALGQALAAIAKIPKNHTRAEPSAQPAS
jgi:hypothetical protein